MSISLNRIIIIIRIKKKGPIPKRWIRTHKNPKKKKTEKRERMK